jgi:hypothetical protein
LHHLLDTIIQNPLYVSVFRNWQPIIRDRTPQACDSSRNLDKLSTNSTFSNSSLKVIHATQHSPAQTGTPSASCFTECNQRANLQHTYHISAQFHQIINHLLTLSTMKQAHAINLNGQIILAHKNTCSLVIPWEEKPIAHDLPVQSTVCYKGKHVCCF